MKTISFCILLITLGAIFSCIKVKELATLTTTEAKDISVISATSGGNITNSGGADITSRGVVWNTSTNPVITGSHTTDGSGIGSYSSSLTGLIPNTKYYIRAYAVNSVGTAYGNEVSFTTNDLVIPTLTTSAASAILLTTATAGGNISSDGGGAITARGVCWATAVNPTTADPKTSDGTGTGIFSSSLTGLIPATIYHIRAYATNSVGTAYGNDLTFTTASIAAPTVSTLDMSAVTFSSAVSGGNVTSDGGASVTVKGVCWATTAAPTTANNKTTNGNGTGAFASSLTGLAPGTLYHVRAYATNSAGTSYGNEVTFTTTPVAPATLTTTAASAVSYTTATSGGNITDAGGGTITAKGVCWSTTTSPTTANQHTSDGTGIGTFTSSITGLTPGTLYYVRAYAINSAGTAYGAEVTFTTAAIVVPTLTTTTATAISQTGATTGGNVTSDGGATVTARGVVYALTANPTLSNSVVTTGAGVGTFISNLTGLTPGATYHVRAYATNSAGTAYGSDIQFTTGVVLTPTVTTTAISAITTTTASSGGNVTADGGATVTARGVVYALTANPTLSNSVVTTGAGLGTFVSNLTGLTPGATYHVRAYATNSAGTAYGADLTFTTTGTGTLPTVTTSVISQITQTTAISGGNVTSQGSGTVTARGVCWGRYLNPELTYDLHTSDGSGSGIFTSNLTGLIAGLDYHVRAYATNSAGTAYGSDITFNAAPLLSDIDGNAYKTVQIGTQVWMAENLKTTRYSDGTAIPPITDNTQWAALSTPAFCWFDNNAATYKGAYGGLYNWFAVNTSNLCPVGWHVPNDAEWTILGNYLINNGFNYDGTTTGNKIAKALAYPSLWNTSTTTGAIGNSDYSVTQNKTGYSVLPAGSRDLDGSFNSLGAYSTFWSTSEKDSMDAWTRYLYFNSASLTSNGAQKIYGFSVRCVKD